MSKIPIAFLDLTGQKNLFACKPCKYIITNSFISDTYENLRIYGDMYYFSNGCFRLHDDYFNYHEKEAEKIANSNHSLIKQHVGFVIKGKKMEHPVIHIPNVQSYVVLNAYRDVLKPCSILDDVTKKCYANNLANSIYC
jgi:hypothetical protein